MKIRNVSAVTPEREDSEVHLAPVPDAAAGLPAVFNSFRIGFREMGPIRTGQVFLAANQRDGFDCMSCAWPDPDGNRETFEFCENGAKAFAEEATTKRISREFFEQWDVERLSQQSDYWLGHQGRLTEPMILKPDRIHYEPISWDEAFALIGKHLQELASPHQAIFYTSGRTSNEAAFLYQLFVRRFGTNNLPDCSNMCHESSGSALNEVIGAGKSTVRLEDLEAADCILLFGINPGTNMPRMLTALERAADRGAQIIAVNPLLERGLIRFAHPQELRGLLGNGVALATQYLQVKINGDIAILKGVMKGLIELNAHDREFIATYCSGFEQFRAGLEQVTWAAIEAQSGIEETDLRRLAATLAASKSTIACWAMGLTQHTNGVANVRELTNLMLLQGNIGKPRAGLLCVRGHSNVQGDRTMGIWEKPSKAFLDRIEEVFGFSPPREHGFDTVGAIRAMAAGEAQVFVGMGGNFLSAAPDSVFTAAALQKCKLTVQISTKLNRSHLVTGETALILPCLGRTERDGNQVVTTENTTCQIRSSVGRLHPASPHLMSEVAIVAGMARSTFGGDSPPSRDSIDWQGLAANYDGIRDLIEKVIPGFEKYNERIHNGGGFYLDVPARNRVFQTPDKRAHFTVNELPSHSLQPGRFVMMTIRSHDQFNTTIYGLNDRYRGIAGGRRVIFMNADDIAENGFRGGQLVRLTSHFKDQQREAKAFRVVPYSIPRGCTATYYPEANVLVPIDSNATVSHTPASKFVEISISAEGN